MDLFYYLKHKYIIEDFNTKFIMRFIGDLDFIRNNLKELNFRFEELSPLQYLKVIDHMLLEDNKAYLNFGDVFEKLLFYLPENIGEEKDKDLLWFKFKYNHFWWTEVHDLVFLEYNDLSNESYIKKFETLYNREIKKISNAILDKIYSLEFHLKKTDENEIFKSLKSRLNKIIKEEPEDLTSMFNIRLFNNNNNFNLNISEANLEKLYKKLTPDFIDSKSTSQKDFINVILKDWEYCEKVNSMIYLKMDHYQTYLFWKWFTQKFNIRLSLSDIEGSKLFKNKSAKTGLFTAASISSSQNRIRKRDKEDEDKLLEKKLNLV